MRGYYRKNYKALFRATSFCVWNDDAQCTEYTPCKPVSGKRMKFLWYFALHSGYDVTPLFCNAPKFCNDRKYIIVAEPSNSTMYISIERVK